MCKRCTWKRCRLFAAAVAVWLIPAFSNHHVAYPQEPALTYWGSGVAEITDWGEVRDAEHDGWMAYVDGETRFDEVGTVWIDLHDRYDQYIWDDHYHLSNRVVNNTSSDWTAYHVSLSPGPPEITFEELPDLTGSPFTEVQISPDGYSMHFSGGVVPHEGGDNFFDVTYYVDIPSRRENVIIEQTVVPEPSTLTALLALVAAGLVTCAWRRRGRALH